MDFPATIDQFPVYNDTALELQCNLGLSGLKDTRRLWSKQQFTSGSASVGWWLYLADLQAGKYTEGALYLNRSVINLFVIRLDQALAKIAEEWESVQYVNHSQASSMWTCNFRQTRVSDQSKRNGYT